MSRPAPPPHDCGAGGSGVEPGPRSGWEVTATARPLRGAERRAGRRNRAGARRRLPPWRPAGVRDLRPLSRRIAPHCVSWEKFLLLRLFGAVPMGSGEMQTSDTRSRAARLVLPYVVRFNDWNALA